MEQNESAQHQTQLWRLALEKGELVAESANVRAGRIKLFMVSDVSSVCVNRNNQWMNAVDGQTCGCAFV